MTGGAVSYWHIHRILDPGCNCQTKTKNNLLNPESSPFPSILTDLCGISFCNSNRLLSFCYIFCRISELIPSWLKETPDCGCINVFHTRPLILHREQILQQLLTATNKYLKQLSLDAVFKYLPRHTFTELSSAQEEGVHTTFITNCVGHLLTAHII